MSDAKRREVKTGLYYLKVMGNFNIRELNAGERDPNWNRVE